MSTAEPALPQQNRYSVRERRGDGGWEVVIFAPDGTPGWSRACVSEAEARTFASTVRQHIFWLSEEKFRQYYRLSAEG